MIDAALLAEVDQRARLLGQTRRVFVERALEGALGALGANDAYLRGTRQADRIPDKVPREDRADAFRKATQGKRK